VRRRGVLRLRTAPTQPGSTTVVVAPVEEQANELLRKVVQAFNALGRPVGVLHEAVTRLELANGSRVLALPGKESRVRSYASALLVIDEAARVPDDVFGGASPTLAASGGRLVALSTAFAKSGWFYREWSDPQGEYLRVSVTARDCPRIPAAFLEAERRNLGERWFAMEDLNVFGDDAAAVLRRAPSAGRLRASRGIATSPRLPGPEGGRQRRPRLFAVAPPAGSLPGRLGCQVIDANGVNL
jgi:hypothetical protein